MSAISIEEILKYVNEARTQPKNFAHYVDKELDSFINNYEMPLVPGCNYRVNESKKAWFQCKEFLQTQKPLQPLKLSEALNTCAQDHAQDLAFSGTFSHNSSDGSDLTTRIKRRCGTRGTGLLAENIGTDFLVKGRNHALQTVLGLIIDDGVPSRGHRQNIFNPQISYIGICSKVQGDKIITVMNFHSQDLPLKNNTESSNKNLGTEIKYHEKSQKPKGFGNFGKFMHNFDKPIVSSQGSRYVVSKSTSTSTSYINGKKTVKKVEKLQYNDGTIEENQHIQQS